MHKAFSCAGFVAVWLLLFHTGLAQAQTSLSTNYRLTAVDEQRINEALAARTSLDIVDMPLCDVAQLLSDRYQINVMLSPKKLEEAAISIDTPVTARLEHLPLESILNLILRDLELHFMVRDNVILITTPDDINSPDSQETRVYPVRDLVYRTEDGDDAEPLFELITTTIAPHSWDEVGGPGSIDYLEPTGTLVVTQSWHIHRQIERLIDTARRVGTSPSSVSNGSSLNSKPLAHSRTAEAPPRRYLQSRAQAWQVPLLHADR